MRLATGRKLAAHATVATAFASMTTAGDIPLPIVGGYVLALAVSFWRGEQLGKGRARLFTALTGAALFALGGLVVTGALDLVIAASLFAAALALNRLFARQSAADDGLLYLAALMMLAGGAALSAELLYGLCFAVFALSTTAALVLSHLTRAVEEAQLPPKSADGLVGARLMGGLAALSTLALVGAAVVFFAFPRFTAGLAGRKSTLRQPRVGFSDTVKLGGVGTLRSDTRIAMRLRLEPAQDVTSLDLLWRGKVYDTYEKGGWRAPPADWHNFARLNRGKKPPDQEVVLSVEVLPGGAAGAPVFFPETTWRIERPGLVPAPNPPQFVGLQATTEGDVRLNPPPDAGYKYVARIGTTLDRALGGLGAEYPEEVAGRYLQLPEDLDPRIGALAREWTAGKADPFDKAQAIEKQLQAWEYTTELPGEVPDPLANFLFERKKGHCEFFSTAMTVLLRASGVPARNVTGYFGGHRVDGEDYYVVRGGDAHSWVEVYFPGKGFVAFDPTPLAGRGGEPNPLLAWASDALDRLEMRWRSVVVDYSLSDQIRAVTGALATVRSGFDRLSSRRGDGAGDALRFLGALLAVGLSLALARRLWRRPGKAAAERRRADDAVRLYRRLLERLARRGIAKPGHQTARELVAQLRRAGRPEAEVAHRIVERYLAARFGAAPLAPREVKALEAELAALR